jgi:signal transduction histidine kinase
MYSALVFACKAAAVLAAVTIATGRRARFARATPRPGASPPERAHGALQERRRLAVEIHDGALQLMMCSLNALRQADALLERGHPALRTLAQAAQFAQEAIGAARSAIYPASSTRPMPGLAGRIDRLIQCLAPTAAPRIHLPSLPDLSSAPAVEEALAGILGEAITNAATHGAPRNVWVSVAIRNGTVTGVVRDDGAGFDLMVVEREAQERRSLGLSLMRERARLMGGTVSIVSRPAAGTVVRARLPLRARAANGAWTPAAPLLSKGG